MQRCEEATGEGERERAQTALCVSAVSYEESEGETRRNLGHPARASISLVSSDKSSFFYLLTTIARET